MTVIETSILNKIRDLSRMPELVAQLAERQGLSADVVFGMNVALDEMLSNIIKYGYTDDAIHEIRIRLSVSNGMLVAEIEDDGQPFDPCAAGPVDVDAPLEERKVGGLGIHIVRALMAEVGYARVAGRNRLVMKMLLQPATKEGIHGTE
ncbi:MAG TPA: ATP-binding protein [Burkholderiales bacterium]|nr:ATP-binding protein [Burkholderiales bacterium]